MPVVPGASKRIVLATGGVAVLVAVLAVAAAVYFAAWYVPAQRAETVAALSRELSARTDQRQMGLERWVEDGFQDARTVAEYPAVRALAAASAAARRVAAADLAHVNDLLRLFAGGQGLRRLLLVDTHDRVLAGHGSHTLAPGERRLLDALAASGAIQAGFHRLPPDSRPDVGFVAAVRDARDRRVGAVLVEVDPAEWVWPYLIVAPPLPEPSSEALLVEQRGDSVVWVSPRRKSATPPLADRRLLAGLQALPLADALRGGSQFGSYRDYTGAEVFASTRRIRGAPWGLVVKVDQADILGPFRSRMRREAAGWGAAIGALFLLAAVLWWGSRRVVALELARGRARLAAALDEANDAILVVSPDGRIVDSNRQAERFYGGEPGGLVGRRAAELREEGDRAASGALLQSVLDRGARVWEARHVAADGSVVPVEVSSRAVTVEGRTEIVSVVRDVRERKAAEARILRLNRMLRTLTEISQLMVRGTDPSQLLQEACHIAVEHAGFRLAAAGVAEADGVVRYMAAAGETEYLADVRALGGEVPEGTDPAGSAVREERVVVIDDTEADPRFATWRAAARRHGLRSGATAPIRGATGQPPTGVLTLYAGDEGIFDAEMVALLEELAADLGFALRAVEERHARRIAESGLQMTRERLGAIVAACPVPLVVLERDFTVSGWNPAAERVFGWTAAEVLGAPPPFVPADQRGEADAAFAQLMAGRLLSGLERQRRRKDGSPLDVVLSAAPIPALDGSISGAVVLLSDVTEVRRTAAALRESEAKLRAFFRSDVVGTLYGDVHGDILAANDEFLRIVGYDPTDPAAGRLRWTELTPPEFLALDEAAVREAQRRGSCTPYEKQYVRRDGSRVWVLVGFVLTGERREDLVAFVLDISARKAADAAVRESERRYRSLFDRMLEGFAHCRMIYDGQGRPVDFEYLTVNPAFEKLTGLRDVTGRRVSEVIPGIREANPELLEAYGRAAAGGPPEHFETYVPALGIWFALSVYCPAPGEFVAIFENATERKASEAARRAALEAAQASADRLQNTLDQMMEGCQILDAEWTYLYVNDAAARHGRTTVGALLGRRITDVYPGVEHTAMFAALRRCAQTRTPERFENEFAYPDGSRAWFDLSVQPVPEGVFVLSIDITERALARAALRESEERLRSLYENSTVGLYRTTPEGRIQLANPALVRMLGYETVDELASRDLEREGYEPSYPRAEFRERMATIGEIRGLESAWRRRDGTTVFVRESARAVRDEGGAVQYYEGTVEDVTERREAEQQVRDVNTRLEELIGAVQALAAARTLADVAAVVRSHARRLLGADGATFVVREGDLCHYVDEDAIGPLWKGQRFPLTACISGWAMLNRQAVVVPDIFADPRIPIEAYRTTFVKSLAMVPIRTEDPLGAIGSYWATPHHASALQVRLLQTLADAAARALENVSLLDELEDRVRQRTEELAAANRELEAFAYSVSHDLRAPLRAVDGFGRMLEEDSGPRLDEEGRRLIGVMRHNTRQMGQLIDDLLAFSRAGRAGLAKTRVEMTGLARQVWDSLATPEDRAAVTFRLERLPEADADPALTQQVWTNLLANALKFTRGRPVRTIEVGARVEPGRSVYYVRDDGVGFDPRYRDKLFGVFQRLHAARDFEGTGVGLALVQRIVHRHGGTVWADGEVGAGATFYFTLPVEGDA